MVQIKEVELPRRRTVDDIQNILEGIREVDVMWLRNDVINIKVTKINTGITLYLVFGERYIFDDCDRGRWEHVTYITDSLDELTWFLNGL